MLEALNDKFGAGRRSSARYANGAGQTWEQPVFTWKTQGVTVVYDYVGAPNALTGHITVTSDEALKAGEDAQRSKSRL